MTVGVALATGITGWVTKGCGFGETLVEAPAGPCSGRENHKQMLPIAASPMSMAMRLNLNGGKVFMSGLFVR